MESKEQDLGHISKVWELRECLDLYCFSPIMCLKLMLNVTITGTSVETP